MQRQGGREGEKEREKPKQRARLKACCEAATKARRQHLLDTESLYSGPDVGNQGTGDVVLTPQGQSQRCWNVQIASVLERYEKGRFQL